MEPCHKQVIQHVCLVLLVCTNLKVAKERVNHAKLEHGVIQLVARHHPTASNVVKVLIHLLQGLPVYPPVTIVRRDRRVKYLVPQIVKHVNYVKEDKYRKLVLLNVQFVHATAPGPDTFPLMHSVHTVLLVAPRIVLFDPGGQELQVVINEARVAVEYVP